MNEGELQISRITGIITKHAGTTTGVPLALAAMPELILEMNKAALAQRVEGYNAGMVAGWDMAVREVRDRLEEPEQVRDRRIAVKQAAIARGQGPG
ncbi:hypothetical protein [Hypericibacter sp.]|uniref:hypothetical protein n=1 Tax=Hypericibacter sp. TaxID=2705401 RepID=UPI003D6D3898